MKIIENPKVSIVVPVYNASKYLDECLNTLVNQTLKDIEIICVDDGSNDNSIDIINKYKENDNRVKLIQQSNQYAGVARNNGMKMATGKYIMFLDADDFFELNMLEDLYSIAEKTEAKIVVCDYNFYDDNKKTSYKASHFKCKTNRVFNIKEINENVFKITNGAPWNKLILGSFLKNTNLQFQDLRTSNDRYVMYMLIILADRVYCTKNSYVNYRINNSTSLQGNLNINNINNHILSSDAIKHELIERNLFTKKIENDYREKAEEIIETLLTSNLSAEEFEKEYSYLKSIIIPNFYNSEEEMDKNSLLHKLYKSKNSTEYLLSEIVYEKNSIEKKYYAKDSKEYIVGSAIVGPLRKIRKFIKNRNN